MDKNSSIINICIQLLDDEVKKMIRHTVLFKVKPLVSKEAIDNAFRQLAVLKHKLRGIINITGGRCRFHEGKGNNYITHGFCIDFEDEESYNTFLNDPIANPAKSCIINITEHEYEGLFGFDLGKSFQSRPNPLDKYRIPTPRLLPPGSIS